MFGNLSSGFPVQCLQVLLSSDIRTRLGQVLGLFMMRPTFPPVPSNTFPFPPETTARGHPTLATVTTSSPRRSP